jgi:hypothetical protein
MSMDPLGVVLIIQIRFWNNCTWNKKKKRYTEGHIQAIDSSVALINAVSKILRKEWRD